MTTLTLHEDPLSGNCYKVKLTASLVKQPLQSKIYNTLKKETRTPEFLKNVSAYGRIPVLQIGNDIFMPEGNAAIFYIADLANSSLIPEDKLLKAEMLRWMFFEQNQHEVTIASLRFWLTFIGRDKLGSERISRIPEMTRRGEEVLSCMNDHLARSTSGWFVGDNATLADIALYAYTHVASEGGFELNRWPEIVAWLRKVEQIEGYIPMTNELRGKAS